MAIVLLNDQDQRKLTSMVERAAFLGHFDPLTLSTRPREKLDMRIVTALSEQCEEVTMAGKLVWSLTPDSRAAIYQRLKDEGRLEVAAWLVRNCVEHSTDPLGKWLVNFALQKFGSMSALNSEEIGAVRLAKGLIGNFLSGTLPDVDAVLERRAADEALDLVRSPSLVGRDEELSVLWQFVQKTGHGRNAPNAMVVTGIGGSGKSALLAEFARRLRGKDWTGPILVWFDFDRALFSRFDHNVMMGEMARQVGLFLTNEENQDIRSFRSELEKQEQSSSSKGAYGFTENSRSATITFSLWRRYIGSKVSPARTIVLILDTYEEIVMRGEPAMLMVSQWLNGLVTALNLHGIKLVFSGRALPILPAGVHHNFAEPLRVGELPRVAAVALLQQQVRDDVAQPEQLKALVRKFGANPLVLKLIGRHLSVSGPAALKELLNDTYRPGASAPLAQGVLYTRILGRLRSSNPKLQKLAHPGLVLRRVTPHLIAEVLAGPCGLGVVLAPEAQDLFDVLAKQVWLVESPEPAVLLHRKDLRSLMLKLIEGDMAYKAADIHLNASRYYESGSDPTLDQASQQLEALYHKLFLNALPALSPERAMQLLDWTGTDIDCAPPHARATLKYAAGMILSHKEQDELDRDVRGAYHDEQAHSTYDAGGALPRAAVATQQQSGYLGEKFGSFQVLQAFAQGEFAKIAAATEQVVDATLTARHDSRRPPERRDLVDSTLWRVALVALANGEQKALAKMIAAHPLYLDADSDPWIPGTRDAIGYARALDTVVRLLSSSIPLPKRQRSNMPVSHIRTTDQLRAYQLLGAEPGAEKGIAISTHLLRYLRKSFLRFAATGGGPAGLTYDSPLWTLPGPASGSPTLGEIAQVVANAGPVRLEQRPETALGRKLIQGIVPEIYPALRQAFHAARDQQLVRMAGDAQLLTGSAWPAELAPAAFRGNLGHDREQWIMVLIETADRYGKLEGIVFDALTMWELLNGNSALQTMTMALENRLQRQ